MIPLKDTKTSGRFPLITLLLIAANSYVFYREFASPDIERFFLHYALIPRLVDITHPATLFTFVTSLFLHGGLIHLASNMLFLWIFGDNVEDRLGFWYLPFYLLGGTVGSLAQYVFIPDSTLPIVGASGAIAAVLGAYFAWFPRHTVSTLVPIFFFLTIVEIPAFVMLGYWFFIQLFNGVATVGVTDVGGVAYFAHIGGFAFGWLVAVFLRKKIEYEAR
jgi:membrane associated rhomboid family serine protease